MEFRVLIQLAFSTSDLGAGPMEDLCPWLFVALGEIPAPGDVIASPVPWRSQYLVKRVARGEGLDTMSYIDGDPDEVGFTWYDVDVHGEQCNVDKYPQARRIIYRRFEASEPESRTYLLT